MKNAEFNKIIRPLNKEYLEMFQEIPCIENYACTREEFLQAMKQAIRNRQSISNILPKMKDIQDEYLSQTIFKS